MWLIFSFGFRWFNDTPCLRCAPAGSIDSHVLVGEFWFNAQLCLRLRDLVQSQCVSSLIRAGSMHFSVFVVAQWFNGPRYLRCGEPVQCTSASSFARFGPITVRFFVDSSWFNVVLCFCCGTLVQCRKLSSLLDGGSINHLIRIYTMLYQKLLVLSTACARFLASRLSGDCSDAPSCLFQGKRISTVIFHA